MSNRVTFFVAHWIPPGTQQSQPQHSEMGSEPLLPSAICNGVREKSCIPFRLEADVGEYDLELHQLEE